MGKRFYAVTRDLHLYFGLFLSPFVLVFAVSVFYLAHTKAAANTSPQTRTVTGVPAPDNLESLKGGDLVTALRPVLDRLGVSGEINFVRQIPKQRRIVVPVMLPGKQITVDLNVGNRTAAIVEETAGVVDALIHLHKMPGPHNVSVRGNSVYMQVWRVLADVSTYGLLFITLSGIYLWTALRAERRTGGILLAAGAVSFLGLVYGITH